jgi:hypothetical protein
MTKTEHRASILFENNTELINKEESIFDGNRYSPSHKHVELNICSEKYSG